MSSLTDNPEAFEKLLMTKLNKLRKHELIDLSNRYQIQFTETCTCPQLKRNIKKTCLQDSTKMQSIIDELGGLGNLNTETCCICLDIMGRQFNDIGCSSGLHWAHWECLAKTGKEECPLCKEKISLPGSQFFTLTCAKMKEDMRNHLESIGFPID